MEKIISMLLVGSVNSQSFFHVSKCNLKTARGDCNNARACTWCTGMTAALPSGCYQETFAREHRTGHGTFECGATSSSAEREHAAKRGGTTRAEASEPLKMEPEVPEAFPSRVSSPVALPLRRRGVLDSLRIGGLAAITAGLGPPLRDAFAEASESSASLGQKGGIIKLATFDGTNKATERKFEEYGDGLFGGRSAGTTAISNGALLFGGNVASLPNNPAAPGYLVIRTATDRKFRKPFADVSSCEGIYLVARSFTPYKGYSLSFGTKKSPAQKRKAFSDGYKSRFEAPLSEFGVVEMPFAGFGNVWDDVTGNPNETCAENKEVCPDDATLKDMKAIILWAEGVLGKALLEVKEIGAYGCSSNAVGLANVDGALSSLGLPWHCAILLPGGLLAFLVMLVSRTKGKLQALRPPLLLG